MSKLAHVQMEGVDKPYVSDIPDLSLEQITGGHTFATESERVIFKLANHKGTGRVWIEPIDDNVLNEKTKKRERMCLIRGAASIWSSEQKDLDKEYIAKNRRSILFEDNRCVLNKIKDAAAIEFLRNSKHNVGNKNRPEGSKFEIYEWNPAAQEAEAFRKELLEIEVMQLAMEQPIDKVKKHGLYLGIRQFVTDELGEARTEKGLRALYVMQAKRNPETFKSTLNSKEVEINYLVKKAILDSKIDLGGSTGTIKWANGGFICKLPKTRGAMEYLVELALLPNEEGKQFLGELETNAK